MIFSMLRERKVQPLSESPREMSTDTFCLSEEAPMEVENQGPASRWMPPSHMGLTKPALIVTAGETITLQNIRLSPDAAVFMSFAKGLPTISRDGMTLALYAAFQGGRKHIASLSLHNDGALVPSSVCVEIGHLNLSALQLQIEAGPGPKSDSRSNWVAIIDLVVGPVGDISLLRAKSFKNAMMIDEIARLAAFYDHIIFQAREARAMGQPVSATVGIDQSSLPAPTLSASVEVDLERPLQGEHAHRFEERLMEQSISVIAPNFTSRLIELHRAAKGRPLRIASLCAGTAQIEAAILREAGGPVELTLVDFSNKLLDRAKSYMPDHVSVRLLMQDVNDLEFDASTYDIVMCVSGIHHAVELERIWKKVKQAMLSTGELWLVGEQIGANGNRLLPQDHRVANEIFRRLPEKYWKNAHTGNHDVELPNTDFGEANFNGIRSSDLGAKINRFFVPAHVYKRNCFLWRFTNRTYSANYDLSLQDDIVTLRDLVAAEIAHFRDGGTPKELHAPYRPLV